MTQRGQVFKCELCGNMVEVLVPGQGQLVCCGQPMDHLEENTVEASMEKHIPVIEMMEDGVKVKVGSVAHPMEEKHYIVWIELIADGNVHIRFLHPGEPAEAVFQAKAEKITARAYCNLHGLWKSL